MEQLEKFFGQLQKDGKNGVNDLVKWMTDAKIVETGEAANKKATETFSNVGNKANVTLQEFKDVLGKMASDNKGNLADYIAKLSTTGDTLLGTVSGLANKASAAFGFPGK